MNNKIDERLDNLKQAQRKGLMTHVVVGYPSLEATIDIVAAMENAGVDFVELQIPFSDPLADGPTIQLACETALKNGTKVKDAFIAAGQLSHKVRIPLLFMCYFNTVFKYGIDDFCRDAASVGISGLIVPDAPLEAAETEGLLDACRENNLHYIATLAPTSTDDRLNKNAAYASGFVYCMSRQGITGAQQGLAPDIKEYLENVRVHIHVPIAVGFGISNRQRLEAVQPYCDVAVIGSALIDRIATDKAEKPAAVVKTFLSELKEV